MPVKTTRGERFELSFASFVKDAATHFRRDYESEEFMTKWSLISDTVNGSRSLHAYLFKIEREVMYHIDNGVDISETTYADDAYFPTKNEFENYFQTYYRQYYRYGSARMKLSFVECEHIREEPGFIEMAIIVLYNKNLIDPYPEIVRTSEELHIEQQRQTINTLRQTVHMVVEQRDVYERERDALLGQNTLIHRNNRRLRHRVEQMRTLTQKHIRELYARLPTRENCPVCYETIAPEILNVPKCLHYICAPCGSRCTVCPICRDSYGVTN